MATKQQKPKKLLRPDQRQTLQDLCDKCGIQDWDLILVGDGSGSRFDSGSCGWCVTGILKNYERKEFLGATNTGSNNFAEILPYLQALEYYLWLFEQTRKRNKETKRARTVHIITDSQWLQKTAEAASRSYQTRLRSLWVVFDLLARQGLHVHWHWVRRSEIELNRLADARATQARLGFLNAIPKQIVDADGQELSIYDFNPSE